MLWILILLQPMLLLFWKCTVSVTFRLSVQIFCVNWLCFCWCCQPFSDRSLFSSAVRHFDFNCWVWGVYWFSFQICTYVCGCVFVQLQEQLDRFMKMNTELRHKQSVLQAQLKSIVERKTDMEADLKEKNKEIEKLQAQLDRANSNSPVCTLSTQNYSFLTLYCL